MKTPTFEKFLGDKKVFHPELKQSRAKLGGQINLFAHSLKKQ